MELKTLIIKTKPQVITGKIEVKEPAKKLSAKKPTQSGMARSALKYLDAQRVKSAKQQLTPQKNNSKKHPTPSALIIAATGVASKNTPNKKPSNGIGASPDAHRNEQVPAESRPKPQVLTDKIKVKEPAEELSAKKPAQTAMARAAQKYLDALRIKSAKQQLTPQKNNSKKHPTPSARITAATGVASKNTPNKKPSNGMGASPDAHRNEQVPAQSRPEPQVITDKIKVKEPAEELSAKKPAETAMARAALKYLDALRIKSAKQQLTLQKNNSQRRSTPSARIIEATGAAPKNTPNEKPSNGIGHGAKTPDSSNPLGIDIS